MICRVTASNKLRAELERDISGRCDSHNIGEASWNQYAACKTFNMAVSNSPLEKGFQHSLPGWNLKIMFDRVTTSNELRAELERCLWVL
jgi:hypothetical protein